MKFVVNFSQEDRISELLITLLRYLWLVRVVVIQWFLRILRVNKDCQQSHWFENEYLFIRYYSWAAT